MNRFVDWIVHQSIVRSFPLTVAAIVLQIIGILVMLSVSSNIGVAVGVVGIGLHAAVSWINHEWQEVAATGMVAAFVAVLALIVHNRQIF